MSSQQFPRAPLPPAGVGQGTAPTGNSTLVPGGQAGRCSSPVYFRYSFKCFDLLQMNGLVTCNLHTWSALLHINLRAASASPIVSLLKQTFPGHVA